MQLEEHQQVAIRIVEGPETRYLFERIATMQVIQRAGIEIVPAREPARLVGGKLGRQILGPKSSQIVGRWLTA